MATLYDHLAVLHRRATQEDDLPSALMEFATELEINANALGGEVSSRQMAALVYALWQHRSF